MLLQCESLWQVSMHNAAIEVLKQAFSTTAIEAIEAQGNATYNNCLNHLSINQSRLDH